MTSKEKKLSLGKVAGTLPLLLLGLYGLFSASYPVPPGNRGETISDGPALLLCALTVLTALVIAVPELIKLRGIDIQRYRTLYRSIQCGVAGALLAVLLALETNGRQESVDSDFLKTFIDINRNGDDSAAAIAFDPVMRVLVVGRESGRVEFWDTRKPNTRLAYDAHQARTEFIAFGREDGIVLTGSGFDNAMIDPESGPHIWDAYNGTLLVTLKGMWAPGPMVASPIRGFYILADSGGLRIYDHRQRKLVGAVFKLENDAQVTALASDTTTGLIAVGSSNGDLLLMKLDASAAEPRLSIARQVTPHPRNARQDVLTLQFLDEGRLVSVGWLPEDLRKNSQAEIREWDTDTLTSRRTYPFSLQTVNWAASVPDQPLLILAGQESNRGKIELVDLQQGVAWRYKANTSHPRAVLLPEIRAGLILQSGRATQINYLDAQ